MTKSGARVRKRRVKPVQQLKAIRKEMRPGILRFLGEHKRLRDRLVSNWDDADRPTFIPKIDYRSASTKITLELTGAEDARGASISVYRMISGPKDDPEKESTNVRRAVLKGDGPGNSYQPRTSKGVFYSAPVGNNRVVRVSKNLELPGIEYRRWDEAAYTLLNPMLENVIKQAIIKGLKTQQ